MNKIYYIPDNGGFSDKRLMAMKKNNFYLYKAMTHLYQTVKAGDPKKIGGPYRAAFLLGQLQYDDNITGFDTNNLALKLKFLTIALSEPSNISKFKKSYFYNSIIMSLSFGDVAEQDKMWMNYKLKSPCSPEFENKNAIMGALICRLQDMDAPLGLNFSTLIDSFVQTDKLGNYYLEDSYTVEEEVAMDDAIVTDLESLKSHPKFKENYILMN